MARPPSPRKRAPSSSPRKRGPSSPIAVGYSGTPLPQKLGIKDGSRVAVLGAPRGFRALLDPLPPGARLRSALGADPADIVLLFTTRTDELAGRFGSAVDALAPGGGLWVGWPKKTSGVASDLDENAVRAVGLAAGLVDNKVCAIDAIWSGLRFMRRRLPREK